MFDALTEAGITAKIKTAGVFQVDVRKSVTSTNSVLRGMAAEGAPEGLVLVAEEQTAGKGRLGRSFFSPGGHGVYFSLLLRPRIAANDATLITPAAAVAAARAVERVYGVRAGIKWVNDLFLNGKKICGILTEAAISAGSSRAESAVLGIGINVTIPEGGYAGDLAGVATACIGYNAGGPNAAGSGAVVEDGRCRLIAAVLDEFWGFYQNLTARRFLDEYRARSVVLGQDIRVCSGDTQKMARALAIDDDCRLVVRYESGETAALDSGEVSVVMQNAECRMQNAEIIMQK